MGRRVNRYAPAPAGRDTARHDDVGPDRERSGPTMRVLGLNRPQSSTHLGYFEPRLQSW
ncbi:hypothetical protein GA0115260_116264 [Streptomyces sp. MnatMP-M27]|nr:hypothetical protein GA0115260_116264 [Streptomyces sp. MnatMP-M27]